MKTDDDILTKERTYRRQMQPVRALVLRFAAERGWSPIRRGRAAHASVHGPVGPLLGVIDIEMEHPGWSAMPNALQPDTRFTLWCSASAERACARLHSDTELVWEVPFADLPGTAPPFLARAWAMLEGLGEDNLIEWPGPSRNPDKPPHFGPPRRRGA